MAGCKVLLCMAAAFAAAAHAQGPASRRAAEEAVNPPLAKDAGSIVRFDSTLCHIGTLTEDDAPCSATFTFTNVSPGPLLITRVATGCGCTAARTDTKPVPPGGKGSVTLTFMPSGHPGTVDTSALVYTQGTGGSPVARLTLLGNVLPGKDAWKGYRHTMGSLRLKATAVRFGRIIAGTSPEERILCGNSGNTPLRLSAAGLPRFVSFRTEPAVIDPGCEADIVITIHADSIPHGERPAPDLAITLQGTGGTPSSTAISIITGTD